MVQELLPPSASRALTQEPSGVPQSLHHQIQDLCPVLKLDFSQSESHTPFQPDTPSPGFSFPGRHTCCCFLHIPISALVLVVSLMEQGSFSSQVSPHPCFVTKSYLLWETTPESLCPVLWVVFGWGTGLGPALALRFPGTVIHLGMGPGPGRTCEIQLV